MIAAPILRRNKPGGRSHRRAMWVESRESSARSVALQDKTTVTAHLDRLPKSITRVLAAVAAAVSLASCGGGGVSANPSPIVDSAALTILPATAVMYSGLPTTFILSGGTGAYIVASDNQAVLPVAGGVTGRSITLVPNPVAIDTTVTLTLRDTGSAAPVTATLTVRPGTVNNELTITRTSTVTGCTGVALCSGGDAEVTVRLSQGGIPLAARGVRFAVVSGDFRFITTAAGTAPETLATEAVTVTDQSGVARARVRILPAAANQTAQMQVTDLGSGAFQRTSFVIAQVTQADASFYTVPASVDFVGPRQNQCASGPANVFVFGGTPPYSIGNTSTAFGVGPSVVAANGDPFVIDARGGTCPSEGISATVLVTDAAGRVRQVQVTNKPTADAIPPLVVAPETITLERCDSVASVAVAGGTGSYLLPAAGSTLISATPVIGGITTVQRRPGSPAVTPPTPPSFIEVSLGVSDSVTTQTVTVRLGPTGACP